MNATHHQELIGKGTEGKISQLKGLGNIGGPPKSGQRAGTSPARWLRLVNRMIW
jgi:hypothetical protein